MTEQGMMLIQTVREQSRQIRRMTTLIDMLFVRLAQKTDSDELADIAEEIAKITKGDDGDE